MFNGVRSGATAMRVTAVAVGQSQRLYSCVRVLTGAGSYLCSPPQILRTRGIELE
jgi:hypothetical protein